MGLFCHGGVLNLLHRSGADEIEGRAGVLHIALGDVQVLHGAGDIRLVIVFEKHGVELGQLTQLFLQGQFGKKFFEIHTSSCGLFFYCNTKNPHSARQNREKAVDFLRPVRYNEENCTEEEKHGRWTFARGSSGADAAKVY